MRHVGSLNEKENLPYDLVGLTFGFEAGKLTIFTIWDC